ncbi:MAG TPA: nucleotidyltransferase family protein [Chthoniobacterales bacterium]|jgi:molybdenum cofactor cytidylyltransferase
MIAAVVLAAGGSVRLGQPKQLLRHAGQPLVRRTAIAALEAGCAPVVVVVGNRHEQVAAALEDLPLTVVANDFWEAGIGGSIRAGIEALREADAAVLLACDQMSVDREVIDRLIAGHNQTGLPIVASAYAGTLGIPALFARQFHPALASLTGDRGAKSIIVRHRDQVAAVPFAAGAVDIDVPDDLQHLVPDE